MTAVCTMSICLSQFIANLTLQYGKPDLHLILFNTQFGCKFKNNFVTLHVKR